MDGNQMLTLKRNLKIHFAASCRQLSFLYDPLSYIDPSRLSGLIEDSQAMEIIRQSERGHSALNQLLQQLLELPPVTFEILGSPRQNLLLLPPEELLELAKYLGATIFFGEIRRIILKRQKEELLETIGPEIYNYALRQAERYFPKNLPFDGNGVVGKTLPSKILNAGKFCILTSLADVAKPLQERFKLKFPLAEAWIFPKNDNQLQIDSIWQFTARIHSKFIHPEENFHANDR